MAHVICDADHYVEHLRLALEQPLDMSRVRFRWGGRLETSDAQPIRRLVQSLHDVIPHLSRAAAATDNLPGDRMLARVALDSITTLSHFVPKKRPGLQHHLNDAMHVHLLVAQMVDPSKEIYHLNLLAQCDVLDLLAKMDESYAEATYRFVSGVRKTLYGLSSVPRVQR
ncbi:MAG: hypothetical protein Q8J78_03725, partial [Moraxellaceae bacterium]|nr:hypothetical protein [Moraxellaceae bacterium]